MNEVVELLAARAPKLRRAIKDAKRAGHASVILDGTLIPVDRVAADGPFYSGKQRKHSMNLQVISSRTGDTLWVFGALLGSVHDKKAEWIWGVLDKLEKVDLVTVTDKAYQCSTWAKVPHKDLSKSEPQREANAPTRNSARPASVQMRGSRRGRSSPGVAAAPPRGKLAKAFP